MTATELESLANLLSMAASNKWDLVTTSDSFPGIDDIRRMMPIIDGTSRGPDTVYWERDDITSAEDILVHRCAEAESALRNGEIWYAGPI